ncbi:MAG: hypothetical protein JWM68_617 [Verrucomicrobiales bacterium]|nr:hypothetical protein [Verrucomicrobiales bacterium]
MKHLPFVSKYRTDYEIVEQRQGKLRLYPHTEQLPVILRAIDKDFYTPLPARIARVDHRASGFDKIVRKHASLLFCGWINADREDELRLHSLLGRDLVARPSIVQQISEDTPRGRCHRFRFYAGDDFFTEIYLCGKRVVFSDHVLQRFSSRAELCVGEDVSNFLISFFGSPIIAMPVGPGRAFIVSYLGSILAMTYTETPDEYFITTCLTINEINSLSLELPPHAINLHYDLPYRRPKMRNWGPTNLMLEFHRCWERKVLPTMPKCGAKDQKANWYEIAHFARDNKKKEGHALGSQIQFADGIPGPLALEALPGQQFVSYDEMEACKKSAPDYDWDTRIAEREANGTLAR